MRISERPFIYETRRKSFIELTRKSLMQEGFSPVYTDKLRPETERWFGAFESSYVHRSGNSCYFELQCFRRYFALIDIVKPDEAILLLDSDVLVCQHYELIKSHLESFGSVDFLGSRGFDSGRSELQISPHFSVWTRETAKDFCDFLIKFYSQDGIGEMLDKLQSGLAGYQRYPSISDMVLIYCWLETRGIKWASTNLVKGGYYIDHNITLPSAENVSFKCYMGTKRIGFGREIHLYSSNGEVVKPLSIHFPGRYKKLIASVSKSSQFNYHFVSALIKLSLRIK